MKNKIKFISTFIIMAFIMTLIILNKDNLLNIINNIITSFNRTLIEENRYKFFIKGLKNTLLISFTSIVFGTILGFILFLLQKTKYKIINLVSYTIVRFLQGVPITVLLLTFYFGVFASVNINPILVAIITFSLYFSAYVTEIFKGAFASINKTQVASSYSLGFTKIQTLKYIVIPQILVYIIPVYKNASVQLIKSTSIASYISIMDLTKASDIVRNRTYEAFFPLIFVALIYFVICFLFCKLLDYVNKKVNPRMVKIK